MDIVNRLKTYMDSAGITNMQFADACKIPRPTLSQILSGRNKKISDEVIAKIHAAYPRLSVLWLLFGEGQMELPANNQIPEPQKSSAIAAQTAPANDFAPLGNPAAGESFQDDGGLFGMETEREQPLVFDDEVTPAAAQEQGEPDPVISIPADGSRTIVNIMVFYSDNSYQSFVPR